MIKKILLTAFMGTVAHATYAQSTTGITGTRDTGYSNYTAYKNALKEHPEISLVEAFHFKDVAEKRDQIYCTRDERKLKADVFYPAAKSKKKRIAIVMIHGGGWRSGDRSQHHPLAQKLAHLGYVCITPEYRLSTEALYPAGVHDVKAALRWTRSVAGLYNIDTAKIVVAGFSAGGELAALMGTTSGNPEFEGADCNTSYSSKVQAVVDIDGTLSFVHPESGEGVDGKTPSAGTYWFGYTKKENPELWAAASPLAYASTNTPPTLFLNSSVDRMHAGRTDYIRLLDSNHIYTEVKTFEGAPHSFCLFNPWFEPTVNTIDNFLKKIFH